MLSNGVWVIDAQTLAYARFIPTGSGAHGVYPSRDASAATSATVTRGRSASSTPTRSSRPPCGPSPAVAPRTWAGSIDGTELWLSGRYNSVVYVFDTRTGQVTHRIPVDAGPTACCSGRRGLHQGHRPSPPPDLPRGPIPVVEGGRRSVRGRPHPQPRSAPHRRPTTVSRPGRQMCRPIPRSPRPPAPGSDTAADPTATPRIGAGVGRG
jgi:hypothetical protein